jgi:predicted dehydrogenase
MKKPLRFLLSGPGLIGYQHALRLHGRNDCVIAAVVKPVNARNFDEEGVLDGVPVYHDVAKALASEVFDAAIISSPNNCHLEQAVACIDRGIPVLVEKPIADTLESARCIAQASIDKKVPVLVGHHRTYNPLIEVASGLINSPKFGRLVGVQGSAIFYKPEKYFEEGCWRTEVGGGVLLINLIHEIGLMRHLCGEIQSVTALSGHEMRNFAVEDSVTIGFRFANGALGSFLLSDSAASNKSWEMTSGENPAYPHHPEDSCYHFAGTNGSVDFPTMKYRYYDEGVVPSWWTPFESDQAPIEAIDPLNVQIEHFVNVIKEGREPLVSAVDGYRNMLVVDAIKRSIDGRCVIELPEDDFS